MVARNTVDVVARVRFSYSPLLEQDFYHGFVPGVPHGNRERRDDPDTAMSSDWLKAILTGAMSCETTCVSAPLGKRVRCTTRQPTKNKSGNTDF